MLVNHLLHRYDVDTLCIHFCKKDRVCRFVSLDGDSNDGCDRCKVNWGNSLAVRIPQHLAKEIYLAEGSEIELTVIDGTLVIKPKIRKRYSLDQLIHGITPENLHAEIDSGTAVGNEW